MFRWYDPLRSWPSHITVLWKSHLYSPRRCGMLWCLSAEKCTRLPSNAVMTHAQTQTKCSDHSSAQCQKLTLAVHVKNTFQTKPSPSSPLATRLSSDMGLVSFLTKTKHYFWSLLVRAAELLQVQTHRQTLNICSILPAFIERIYWSRYQRQKRQAMPSKSFFQNILACIGK